MDLQLLQFFKLHTGCPKINTNRAEGRGLLPHSAPSWILSLAENLASSSLQDGATEWHYSLTGTTYPLPTPTHPTTAKLFL